MAVLAAAAVLAPVVAPPSAAVAQVASGEVDAEARTAEAREADAPGAESGRVSCDDASEVFYVLCETFELIDDHFVDPIPHDDLAESAARGVREAALAPRRGEAAPACALPAPGFEQTCVEIDSAADTAAAVWAASAEMLASLNDPFTHLMTPEEYDAFVALLEEGEAYSGIGVRLGLLDGVSACAALSATCRLVIAEVFAGSPAEAAGLRVDDILLELDGLIPSGEGCGLGALRGFDPGTQVMVKVERRGRVLDFRVEAALVTPEVAAGRIVEGGIGYLRLDAFSPSVDQPLAGELRGLLDAGVDSLVLDLRGNPGGYLETVVNVAGLFLGDELVVAQEVFRQQVRRDLSVSRESTLAAGVLPMVVAVDGSSASASELLSLALRDHGRATLVGSTTFGKNTGQITQPLQADDATVLGAVRLTVLRWLSPDGLSAAGGIEPDVTVMFPPCAHPVALARQSAAAAGLPGAALADVGISGERFDAVAALAADGVLMGTECEPGLFCPDDPVARADLAVWLVRILDGADPLPAGLGSFQDVDPSQWWAAHVQRLLELGVTRGCGSGWMRFCPDESATRAQMASLLVRAFDMDEAAPAGFVDTLDSFAAADIDKLFASGITKGCSPDGMLFCPKRAASRAEAAILIDRARSR